ncbi:MAG: right-handed parallel beta-helix repeat-containing protein [Pirellulaceae bacterium]
MTIVFNRRVAIAAALTAVTDSVVSSEDGRPKVTRPRATDGDDRSEPDWDEHLTITVGNQGADINGKDDRAIQAAVDYIRRIGTGTVKLTAGVFQLRNSIHLPSNLRMIGSGDDTVITKDASHSANIVDDSDWYDQEITLKAGHGFRVGDGVFITAKNTNNGDAVHVKRTLVANKGNRFKLNDGLRKNIWLTGNPKATSVFPLLTSEYSADVLIENLVLDGNRANNVNMNGNYGGCIFLQDCKRYTMRGVTTRNYNGDGISFQICHDVIVENCKSHGNADLGVHPGSGSQRPLIRKNHLFDNSIGIFWCWGVRYGLAENNFIKSNKDYGISIGHCDTDNTMRDNDVIDSGKVGILFRNDTRGRDFWANRNLITKNRISNSGGGSGVAIKLDGQTKDTKVIGNIITDDRGQAERIGIEVNADVGNVQLIDNKIEGVKTRVIDNRVP